MALNGLFNFGIIFRAKSNLSRLLTSEIKSLKKLNAESDAVAASLARVSSGLSIAAMGLASAFIAGGFATGISRAAELENQLQRTRIVTGQAFESNMALGSSLVDVSNKTGRASKDLAMLTEIAGTSGLAAKFGAQGFIQFADTATKFSKVAGISARQAANTLAPMFQQLGLDSVKQLDRLASVLVVVGKNSISGVAEVARFMKGLAPLRAQSRLTVPQLAAIAGAAKSIGNISEELLTSNLPKFFRDAAVNASKLAPKMGMTANEIVRMIDAAPFEFFLKFLGFLKGFEGRLGTLGTELKAMGITSIRLFKIIAGGAGQIDKMTSLLKLGQKEWEGLANTLDEDFAMAMNTAVSQMERFWSITTNVLILLGTPFLAPLTLVLRTFNALGSAISFLLKSPLGQLFAAILGITSVLGVFKAAWAGITALIIQFGGQTILSALTWTFFTGVIGGAVGMFKALFVSVATVLIPLVAVWTFLKSFFGPGLMHLVDVMGKVISGAKELASVQGLALVKFEELEQLGVANLAIAFAQGLKTMQRFGKGFALAFKGFPDLGRHFKAIIDLILVFLDSVGLVSRDLQLSGSSAERFGMIVGSMFQTLIDLVDSFLELISPATKRLEAFFMVGRIAKELFFAARGPLPIQAPEPGGLPIRTTSSTPTSVRDTTTLAREAAERVSAGKESPTDVLGTVVVKSMASFVLDSLKVGEAVSEAEERKRLGEGELTMETAAESGF